MLRYGNRVFEMYGEKVKQVNKIAAKNAYEHGETVYLLSCNMRPNNMWQSPCPINKERAHYGEDFECVVNSYIYYNCDNERGKYPIFFVEVN